MKRRHHWHQRSRANKARLCPETKKVRYRTQNDASSALGHLSTHSTRDQIQARTYFCGMCGGWHLTSWKNASGLDDEEST